MVKKNKNDYVTITCTTEDKELLYSKAEAEGLKFTDWARLILLNTTLKDALKKSK